MALFGRSSPPSATTPCASPCKQAKDDGDALTAATAARIKRLTGQDVPTNGNLPGDFGPSMMASDTPPCKAAAYDMGPIMRRYNRYRDALPYARAAEDTNALGDKANTGQTKNCLTRLPDDPAALNKALGLPPGTIAATDIRNDKTGFRAVMYRSDPDGKLIMVGRDTEPHSLVDWKTNTDNGAGLDTDQYQAMRKLAGKMQYNNVPFDLSGYSKGGGLAQEAGLVAPDAKVVVFNSAGLSDASLARTGNSSFAPLAQRTSAFSADGDFLTYMNNTTSPDGQIANAQYLRDSLAKNSFVAPIGIEYRNPEMLATPPTYQYDPGSQMAYAEDPDPNFAADKQKYLAGLDTMISRYNADRAAGIPFQMFPPVRAKSVETIAGSMTKTGKWLGATKDEPNLGHLAQHKMDNVVSSLEGSVDKDQKAMQKFLKDCG